MDGLGVSLFSFRVLGQGKMTVSQPQVEIMVVIDIFYTIFQVFDGIPVLLLFNGSSSQFGLANHQEEFSIAV